MPAGLPGSFAEAGCGEEPAHRALLIGLTRVDQPWEQTQQAPRNYNLPQGRTQSLIANSDGPRTLGAGGGGGTQIHTLKHWTHSDTLTHPRTQAHTSSQSRTLTRKNTCFPPPPSPAFLPGFSSLFEGRGQTSLFHLQASTPVFTCPDKTVIFLLQ